LNYKTMKTMGNIFYIGLCADYLVKIVFLVVLLGFVFPSNKQRMPYNRYTYIFQ